MFKFIGFCLKVVPSVVYIVQLNVFVRDNFRGIGSQTIKNIFIYGVPSSILLGVILYFFIFKDSLIRQKAKESDEDESRAYTVGIQLKRMIRKYIPLALLGIVAGLMVYFYKPLIITLSIKIGLLYFWFLLGETFRIIDIGLRENKRNKKELKG
jgi:ABC-type molybdate transport system permease subunit